MNGHHYYFSKLHQSHWSILQPHHNQPLIYKMFTLSGFVAVCPLMIISTRFGNVSLLNLVGELSTRRGKLPPLYLPQSIARFGKLPTTKYGRGGTDENAHYYSRGDFPICRFRS